MIKLFVTDLDGTFLANHHVIGNKEIETVNELNKNGCFFVVATGRNPYMANIDQFDCFTICANGAIIFDKDGKIIFYDKLDEKWIIQLEELGYDYEYVTSELTYRRQSYQNYVDNFTIPKDKDYKWAKQYMEDSLKSELFSQSLETILALRVCKINVHKRDNVDYSRLDDFLLEHKDELINSPANKNLYEITNKNTTKASAISFLCKYLGITEDEVAVFGDGGNDIEMLKSFNNSYAVSDGDAAAVKSAHYTIGSHDSYSVSKTMLSLLKNDSIYDRIINEDFKYGK